MKVYTRGGDKGATSLFDGTRVPKSNPRVEAYGMVDELNAFVGLARAGAPHERVRSVLERIGNELFTVGADLATPSDSKRETRRIESYHVTALEKDTDSFFDEVGPPGGFVVPGEAEGSARLHVARTVAGRAERAAVALSETEPVNPELVRYLNRLSSLLYAMSVWCDKVVGGRALKNPSYR